MENMNIDDLSRDEAMIVLFFIFMAESSKEAYCLWDEFEKEIKHNNRFFPKAKILDRIRLFANDAAAILKRGSVFYRARTFPTSFLDYEGNKKEQSMLLLSHSLFREKANSDGRRCPFFKQLILLYVTIREYSWRISRFLQSFLSLIHPFFLSYNFISNGEMIGSIFVYSDFLRAVIKQQYIE